MFIVRLTIKKLVSSVGAACGARVMSLLRSSMEILRMSSINISSLGDDISALCPAAALKYLHPMCSVI